MTRLRHSCDASCRKSLPSVILVALPAILFSSCRPPVSGAANQSAVESGRLPEVKLYDPDPGHLWNRLYRTLFLRMSSDGATWGYDRLDPLLWHNTQHLVVGESYQSALAVLDEFLNQRAPGLIQDPLKRAVLQHDLWGVFDWAASHHDSAVERLDDPNHRPLYFNLRALRLRLAQAIQRLGLDADQFAKLPDNYAAAASARAYAGAHDPEQPDKPFLPTDLFQKDSPWVCLGPDYTWQHFAREHVGAFSGRSAFLVFLRLPEGRKATLQYLERFKQKPGPNATRTALPPLPDGTQVALVRRMILIDSLGRLTPTRLTESVQIRVFNQSAQNAYEFQLSRPRLFTGQAGGLRALEPNEKDFLFVQFRGHGIDELEWRNPGENQAAGGSQKTGVVLQSCVICHRGRELLSMQVLLNRDGPKAILPADPEDQTRGTAWWKRTQYDWGLLTGLLEGIRHQSGAR